MMLCAFLRNRIYPFLSDYDRLQSFAVILIYIQIGCTLIGSLGALFNGVLLINLGIALFALVAIESSSQNLVRTYAVLLFSALLLDISWFFLFGYEIWTISSQNYDKRFIFSVKLAFLMHIIGFAVRLSSSFFWIQMYRLGVSSSHGSACRADYSFLNPTTYPVVATQTSDSDEVIGGSPFFPTSYSSLFEDGQENEIMNGVVNNGCGDYASTPTAGASPVKPLFGKHFQTVNEEAAMNKV